MSRVVVVGSFDDMRSAQVRFLQEASRLGPVLVFLWSDEAVRRLEGREPKCPLAERQYFLEALRYVDRVIWDDPPHRFTFPVVPDLFPATWVVEEGYDSSFREFFQKRISEQGIVNYSFEDAFRKGQEMGYRVLRKEDLQGFPDDLSDAVPSSPERTRVLVTGCYDWFHSGHVRFFEEVSQLGDLYVVVGHDANIRLLKGEGHPLFPEAERRYMVQAVRHVTRALISTGTGWLDAEPEIERIRPHLYVVNEDGDRSEKRAYCEAHGIEYRVLKRLPREGLPRRQSTDLRGF